MASANSSFSGRDWSSVGIIWSTVAKVRFGNRTGKIEFTDHREGLRTRHFMDQVRTDQKLGLACGQFSNAMRVPDFLKEALRLIRHGLRPCAFSTRKRVLQRVLFGGSDCVAEALSVFFFRLCPKGESFAVMGLSV